MIRPCLVGLFIGLFSCKSTQKSENQSTTTLPVKVDGSENLADPIEVNPGSDVINPNEMNESEQEDPLGWGCEHSVRTSRLHIG